LKAEVNTLTIELRQQEMNSLSDDGVEPLAPSPTTQGIEKLSECGIEKLSEWGIEKLSEWGIEKCEDDSSA